MNHAEIQMVFVSANHITSMLKLATKIPLLKVIISIDPLEDSIDHIRGWAAEYDVKVYEFSEIENLGRENPIKYNPPLPNDLFVISYTSGTTGISKGVMIAHKNIAAMIATLLVSSPITSDDVIISYLPLAHIFGLGVEICSFFLGISIRYYRGDILGIFEDVKVLKPTLFPSVPRIFNKITSILKSHSVEAPGITGILARKAVRAKLENLEKTGSVTHPIWDRLLLNKYKAFLGGRIKNLTTGGAPIAKDVKDFLKTLLSIHFREAYGQTETTGAVCATVYGDIQSSHVGPPTIT